MTRNDVRMRDNNFTSEVLHVISRLRVLASGEIERGRRKNRHDFRPGMRRLTMGDVRALTQLAVDRLTNAVSAFVSTTPTKQQWNQFEKPLTIHAEPADFKHDEPESCSVCRKPTRSWLPDKHTPLCADCCYDLNKRLEQLLKNEA